MISRRSIENWPLQSCISKLMEKSYRKFDNNCIVISWSFSSYLLSHLCRRFCLKFHTRQRLPRLIRFVKFLGFRDKAWSESIIYLALPFLVVLCIDRVNPSNIKVFKFEYVLLKEQNYNYSLHIKSSHNMNPDSFQLTLPGALITRWKLYTRLFVN